jgi:hypothetical protein
MNHNLARIQPAKAGDLFVFLWLVGGRLLTLWPRNTTPQSRTRLALTRTSEADTYLDALTDVGPESRLLRMPRPAIS